MTPKKENMYHPLEILHTVFYPSEQATRSAPRRDVVPSYILCHWSGRPLESSHYKWKIHSGHKKEWIKIRTDQSPSPQVNCCSFEKFTPFYGTQNSSTFFCTKPPLVCIPSQTNPLHNLLFYLLFVSKYISLGTGLILSHLLFVSWMLFPCECFPSKCIWISAFPSVLRAQLSRPSLFNPINAELNPICHFLALLGAHHILHVSRMRVNDTLFYGE